MSLKIYRSINDIPKGIKIIFNNDSYFSGCTNLSDDDLTKSIIFKIDKAMYRSEYTFLGRDKELGGLNKDMLSTGCKTLLNVIQHPNICFDITECGYNALQLLPLIKNGMVLWSFPFVPYAGDEECDIEYDNVVYSNFFEFMEAVDSDREECICSL